MTTSYSNSSSISSTSGSSPSVTSLACCFDGSYGIGTGVWASSVEVTVATIITQTFLYGNTMLVNTTTIAGDHDLVVGQWDGTSTQFTVILTPHSARPQIATVVYDTAVTDYYGNVVQSPTPFFMYSDAKNTIAYRTALATRTASVDSSSQCVNAGVLEWGLDTPSAYPPGAWLPFAVNSNTDSVNDLNFPQAFVNYYLSANISLNPVPNYWFSINTCNSTATFENMLGGPTPHIPANEITVSSTTTTSISANYTSAAPPPSLPPTLLSTGAPNLRGFPTLSTTSEALSCGSDLDVWRLRILLAVGWCVVWLR